MVIKIPTQRFVSLGMQKKMKKEMKLGIAWKADATPSPMSVQGHNIHGKSALLCLYAR